DIIAIHPRYEDDIITTWCCETFWPWVLKRLSPKPDPWLHAIIQKDKTVRKATRLVLALIASSIQVVAVVSLSYVAGIGQRLGIMAMSRLTFSMVVSVSTKCTRAEMFGVNAA